MKKWAYALLGLFLAGMALAGLFSGDYVLMAIGCAFGFGSWKAFKAAGRHAPARTPEASRPWER